MIEIEAIQAFLETGKISREKIREIVNTLACPTYAYLIPGKQNCNRQRAAGNLLPINPNIL